MEERLYSKNNLKFNKMFTAKKSTLLDAKKQTSVVQNAFVNASLKSAARTLSGNGALKFSTTGNEFVNQFGSAGKYKEPRAYADIARDCSILWEKSPLLSVMFIIYLRTITRVVSLFNGLKTSVVQRGAGLKHEAITRMIWLHVNHQDAFWKNITLFISVGSWKDIIVMLSYDLQYNGWKDRVLNWDKMGAILLAGLENPQTSNLIKKYLPQIKANSKCTTLEAQADNMIAKWICSLLFGSKSDNPIVTYKLYRKLKVSGTAHQWQQLISKRKFLEIDFNTIHGKALAQLVSGKFITNNGLEAKYQAWIESKPIAKFTGYVHELFQKIPTQKFQEDTLNKQFYGLVETANNNANTNTGMIVVRDTSRSMGSIACGTKQTSYDIAKALALFFSYMLPDGAFANSWIEFNSSAKMHQWKGSTPLEKWKNDTTSYVGSTSLQSVIDLFVQIKQAEVPENQFPSGIICISDGEFNPTVALNQTNVAAAFQKLRNAGFSRDYIDNFKIVLWNIPNSHYGTNTTVKFETYGNVPNVFYFGGYDGAIISFLTGAKGQETTPTNPEQLFQAAMDQEVIKMVEV